MSEVDCCVVAYPESRSLFRPLRYLFLFVLPVVFVTTACSQIRLEPKDLQLQSFEKLADNVTTHLFDTSPATYEQYQGFLVQEISPVTLNQLKKQNRAAKNPTEITSHVQAATKSKETCVVKVASTYFPGQATKEGLVPVEVKGVVIKSSGGGPEKETKFDVTYLIGESIKNKQPMVSSLQIK